MRSFTGSRDTSKKKGAASQDYKARLAAAKSGGPPPDPNAIYKKKIEERMAKMMEDVLMGKKKNTSGIPGAKMAEDDKPKEVSKTTLMVIKMLAVRREQKSIKAEKKREAAWHRDKRAKLAEEKRLQTQADLLLQQKEAEMRAQQEAANNATTTGSYWGVGLSDDNKGGWW